MNGNLLFFQYICTVYVYNFTGVQASGVIIIYSDIAVSYGPKLQDHTHQATSTIHMNAYTVICIHMNACCSNCA